MGSDRRLIKIEVPKSGNGRAGAGEDDGSVVMDNNFFGSECGKATMITELANGNERRGGKIWKDVSSTCGRW